MGKGERTRARVAARAAEVFNVRGYAGASMSDIMAATGLEKGGIYNHFGSKEDLVLAGFDHAAEVVRIRFADAWDAGGVDALLAFVATFRSYAERPPLAGGCPVLNAATESDDTHPALRARTRAVVDDWRDRLAAAVADGAARGEIRPGLDPDALATLLIGSMEGAVMLSKLYGDPAHLDRMAAAMTVYVEREVRMPSP